MPKRIHFLGIGGSGASAIAAIAQSQGYVVDGCDKNPNNEFTQIFDKSQLLTGHDPSHVENADIVAITPAILSLDPNNKELVAAKEKGIPVMTWQEFMGKYLEDNKIVVAVCGTHGKSTTTSMAGLLMEDAGLDPTVEIGAIVPKWRANYRIGKSKYFVTEADEFNDNFLASTPDIAIVTNIEMDHPEYFADFEDYKKSFINFISKTKTAIIANISDPGVAEVMKEVSKKTDAACYDYSQKQPDLNLKVPGSYNVLNASAVYQLGLILKIPAETIRESLENYTGIGRRFEFMGQKNQVAVYSDFGHHPTEIRVTVQAARDKFKDKKIWVIFQPHMFSRTHALFADFVKVFQDMQVERISIMDIYPSREIDTGLVNSKQLVEAVEKAEVEYLPTGDEIIERLNRDYNKYDVLFFIGAGSTHNLAKRFLS